MKRHEDPSVEHTKGLQVDAFQSVFRGLHRGVRGVGAQELGRVGVAPRPEAVEPRLLAEEVVQRGRRGEDEGLPLGCASRSLLDLDFDAAFDVL